MAISPDTRPTQAPRLELKSLAPDMPEELGKLSGFYIYAVSVAKDGLSCEVANLQKIDQEKAGFKVVDKLTFSNQYISQARNWLDNAFTTLLDSRKNLALVGPLERIDEITKVASVHMEEARKRSLPS